MRGEAGAVRVDVEDPHGDGAGFERGGEERGGEVGFGEHAEEVDGGEVEKLGRVDEEDSDAGRRRGVGGHCLEAYGCRYEGCFI